MATLPAETTKIIEQFGPHLSRASGQRLDPGAAPDRLVKTHCCFCGQQCGIQLKVKDNEVIGFEPWEDFPFNRGMLCPKGVKRYLQGAHPDRLLHAYRRDPVGAGRLQRHAHTRRRSSASPARSQRIQSEHGRDAFAVLSGASLTTEKTYLMGKFARVCLGTANIDYNGRLCMVSAAAGNKKAFGIDRAANPWSDILDSRRGLDQRRERRRVRTDHHQLRLAGARARREDHRRRSAHHADRPHLRPVSADQARPRHRTLQRHSPPDDRERLARPRFHRAAHGRLRGGRRARAGMDAASARPK